MESTTPGPKPTVRYIADIAKVCIYRKSAWTNQNAEETKTTNCLL